MHVTLHFLGEAEIELVAAALAEVAIPAFRLDLQGVGQFPSAGGATTLWAGVCGSPEMLLLPAATAAKLMTVGFRLETRPYTPHVTLARCEPSVAASVVYDFLARHQRFSLPSVSVKSLGLFSSTFANNTPVYKCKQSFPLLATGGENSACDGGHAASHEQ